MNDLPAAPSNEVTSPRAPLPPRVSLQFLFVWTTAVAVLTVLGMGSTEHEDIPRSPFMVAITLGNSVVFGACLATWLYAWKYLGGQAIGFPLHPGHYFALLFGIQYVGTLCGPSLAHELKQNFLMHAYTWRTIVFISFYVLTAAGWFIVFLAPFQHRVWKILCGAYLIWCICGLASQALFWFLFDVADISFSPWVFIPIQMPGALAALAILIATIVATMQDLGKWSKYDWLHWLGVGTLFYIPLSRLAVSANEIVL